MDYDYDVVVIGAGPGGSMAAKTCAEEGLNVLLVEKRQEIGAPVRCAEGISKEGLERFFEIDRKWIAREVSGAIIYSPDGTELKLSSEMAGNEVGFVLERKIFDRDLARMASKAGAEVIVKTTATGMEREKDGLRIRLKRMGEDYEVTAKIVVGADGVESRVGKWAGIDTTVKLGEIESCVQYLMTNIEFDPDFCHFWIGQKYAPGGYVWLFPKGESSANVGIGILPTMTKKTAKWWLDRFVQEYYPDGKIVEFVVGGVPVTGPIDTAVSDNVMLVGDAARHADPITGGGIANAIKGGYFAGKVAKEAVDAENYSKEFLRRYDEMWKNDFGKTLHRNKLLQKKFLKLSDETLDRLIRSIAGYNLEEISVKRLVLELIKKNPKLLWDIRHLFT
ncbi:2,3-di-O-geranylgeranylglyceryl phosphate reductase [Archaeoglobus sulfaticallidus PM70-1]|uniref:Digeranylgeranylglycerophospholipid reductase n=1 Tax=Archaeoglobus sulfaticallidus PM70-1 TaxID=387631 RepID=N0BM00_9EURY|nr:NAD(P)/FAD-dependent oxidoreductase [Archaeoglobus sulfaticallidus]AGK61601.1 2,3-di-O-geranylgeranylglyceryl phosphate reductase [Archaeoglobus sulfaticallidus PM70-1]